MLVFASDHWNFNVRGFNPGGNHGSLLRVSTHSTLLFAGAGIPQGLEIDKPYDSLSLVPTLLRLTGREAVTNGCKLPGPLIEELFGSSGRQ
jgi:arylsulfatase A-like enzyme